MFTSVPAADLYHTRVAKGNQSQGLMTQLIVTWEPRIPVDENAVSRALPRKQANLRLAGPGSKFVVSWAREAYHAPGIEPDLKSRLGSVDKTKGGRHVEHVIPSHAVARSGGIGRSARVCVCRIAFGRGYPRRLGHGKSAAAHRAQAGYARWGHHGFT